MVGETYGYGILTAYGTGTATTADDSEVMTVDDPFYDGSKVQFPLVQLLLALGPEFQPMSLSIQLTRSWVDGALTSRVKRFPFQA